MSQTLIVSSSLPLASIHPFESKATLLTGRLCPLNVRRHSPLSAFHNWTVVSEDGDASIRPSADHAMCPISPVCPRKERASFTPGGSLMSTAWDSRSELSFCLFLAMVRSTLVRGL